MESVIIQKACGPDYAQVASLHERCITEGFLSELGAPFLNILYSSMGNSAGVFCITANCDGRVVGFISGAADIKNFHKEFFRKNLFKAGIAVFPKLFRKGFIKKIIDDLFYPSKNVHEPAIAELMSIAVDAEYRGKGISEKLFLAFKDELRSHGIKRFKVICGAGLSAACRFYEKSGGISYAETEIHKGEKSRVYLFDV